MVTNGMFAPAASGWSPTQLMMISPVCSVKPSPRSGVLFVAWALQFSCCAKASPVNRASTANTVTTLRKLTISFLLLVNFELNRSKLSFQPEPQKRSRQNPFSQPRELLRVGRRIVFRKPLWPSGLTEKPYLRHMIVISCVFCAHRYKYKIAFETGRGKDIHS